MLATAGAAFGAASLSGADDHDPRSKEQPPSVIAIKAIRADAHGLSHEAPEEGLVTGMVIDAETHAACAILVACCAAKCTSAHSAKSRRRGLDPRTDTGFAIRICASSKALSNSLR